MFMAPFALSGLKYMAMKAAANKAQEVKDMAIKAAVDKTQNAVAHGTNLLQHQAQTILQHQAPQNFPHQASQNFPHQAPQNQGFFNRILQRRWGGRLSSYVYKKIIIWVLVLITIAVVAALLYIHYAKSNQCETDTFQNVDYLFDLMKE